MAKVENYLIRQISDDIDEYLIENKVSNSVEKGTRFLEWVLSNVFQLREDEVEPALAIGGKHDNGIDAVFEANNELYIIQGKYGQSQNVDSIHRFINDCIRLLENSPDTNREAVIDATFKIREAFKNNTPIHCCYVTNTQLIDWEKGQVKTALDGKNISNTNFHIYDIESIVERIQLNRGDLPKEFKTKRFKIRHTTACKHSSNKGETYIAVVSLKAFADFIAQDKGSDLIFYSNIRNYLNSTNINSGIRKTIETDPKSFWYYNNGITVVCDELVDNNQELVVTAPQIVNGCQTAKSIFATYKKVAHQTPEDILNDGHILIRFIKIKRSLSDVDKKQFRDDVTRYTNSQNAVKGLDFYSLDQFQRDLKEQFEKNNYYYYEIQRGAYAAEKNRRTKKQQFIGNSNYEYLLRDFNSAKKYVLPAKEVIQSFTAGIKLMPNIAYGRANELTPTGKRWEDIMNEDTKEYKVEAFLFPYLVWLYAKHTLKFTRSDGESYKKNSAFLFVATYFLLINKLITKTTKQTKEFINHQDIDKLKILFTNEELNIFLLHTANDALKAFFRDSQIYDAVGDNMRGFIQNQMSNGSRYWNILERFIEFEINDKVLPKDYWKDIQEIFK